MTTNEVTQDMNKFLERQNLLKLTEEITEYQNRPI